MKIGINFLMIVLLVFFLASFLIILVYGELWRIKFAMTDIQMGEKEFDRGHVGILFLVSCIGIGSGCTMLYLFETRFSEKERKE